MMKVRTIALMLGVVLSFILSSFIFSITSIVKAEPFSDREEINVGTNPFNMIYNPDNGNLYVVDNPSNTVYVISSSNNQIIGSISVNLHPDRIVYDPDNHNLYLLHRFPHLISVISTATNEVIDTIPLSHVPIDLTYNSDNGYVYVTQQISDNSHFPNHGLISVIPSTSNEVIDEIVLLLPLDKIVYDSNNNNLYITHSIPDSGGIHPPLPSVYVISAATNQLINDIAVDHEDINDLDYNSANGNIYATVNRNFAGSNDSLFVISGVSQEVISTVTIPQNPEITTRNLNTIGIDHLNNYIYVSTTYPDTSYVVSGLSHKIIAAIPLSPPTSTCLSSHNYAFDNDRNKLFISNPCHDTVTAISADLSQIRDNIFPDTIITNVVGRDGLSIENESSTTSALINLSYTGIDNVGIDHYQCALDDQAISVCGDSFLKSELAAGIHKFQVSAVDTSNNVDPSPVVFSWEVLEASPIETIQTLKDHISNIIDLPNIYKSGFIARLNAATLYLTDQRESNDLGGACTQLNAFIRTVISNVHAHRIYAQTAFELSEGLPYSAEAIKSKLGC